MRMSLNLAQRSIFWSAWQPWRRQALAGAAGYCCYFLPVGRWTNTHTSNQIQVRWIFLTAGKSGAASDSCESSNKKQNTSTNIILDQPCTLQTQGPTDLLQPRYFENKPCFCACSWKNRCTSDRSERGHANADGWQPHFPCACSFSWNFCLFWLPTVWNILVTSCCFYLTRVFLASYWQNPSSKRFPNVFFVIRMPWSKKLLLASLWHFAQTRTQLATSLLPYQNIFLTHNAATVVAKGKESNEGL